MLPIVFIFIQFLFDHFKKSTTPNKYISPIRRVVRGDKVNVATLETWHPNSTYGRIGMGGNLRRSFFFGWAR